MHFLRRYRATLFPQNKMQDRENEMRITSMAFFKSCLKLLTGNAQSWETRVGLISIIESERIYASQGEGEGVVEGVREDAVRILEGEAEVEEEVIRLALDVLAVLARADYDVIEPVVGRILPRLILVSFVPLLLCSSILSGRSFHFLSPPLIHCFGWAGSSCLNLLRIQRHSSFLMAFFPDPSCSFHA